MVTHSLSFVLCFHIKLLFIKWYNLCARNKYKSDEDEPVSLLCFCPSTNAQLFLFHFKALSEICIAIKSVQSEESDLEHPLDRSYHSLGCELQPLERNSPEFQVGEEEENEKTTSAVLPSVLIPVLPS